MQSAKKDKIVSITCNETGVCASNGILISIENDNIISWHTGNGDNKLIYVACSSGVCRFVKEYEEEKEKSQETHHFVIVRESGKTETVTSNCSFFLCGNSSVSNIQGSIHTTMGIDEYFEACEMLLSSLYEACDKKEDYDAFVEIITQIITSYMADDNISVQEKANSFLQLNLLRYEEEFGCQLIPRRYKTKDGQLYEISFSSDQKTEKSYNHQTPSRKNGFAFDEKEDIDCDREEGGLSNYFEEIKEDSHRAKQIKPNLFFEGICAYKCDSPEKFNMLVDFFKWVRFYKGLEYLDKNKALSTGTIYMQGNSIKYAFDLSRTGCDSYIDLEGVVPGTN